MAWWATLSCEAFEVCCGCCQLLDYRLARLYELDDARMLKAAVTAWRHGSSQLALAFVSARNDRMRKEPRLETELDN